MILKLANWLKKTLENGCFHQLKRPSNVVILFIHLTPNDAYLQLKLELILHAQTNSDIVEARRLIDNGIR